MHQTMSGIFPYKPRIIPYWNFTLFSYSGLSVPIIVITTLLVECSKSIVQMQLQYLLVQFTIFAF